MLEKDDRSLALEEEGERFTPADHGSSRSVVDLASDLSPNCDTFCVTELPPQGCASDV